MKSFVTDQLYAAGWGAVRFLPQVLADKSFATIADEAWRRRGGGVRQLERNLSRVVPGSSEADVRELSKQAMRSYLRYWEETFRLPNWSAADAVERMVVHNEERIWEYRARGRGLVAVLGHFGNWDHCGAWATARGLEVLTVAERLRPEQLFDRFVSYRESLGMEVLPLTGGPDVASVLRTRLEGNAFVCLLADRDLSRGGITVDLLGEPASFPSGPALLAARTGATLMPTISYYDDERTHIEFLPELITDDALPLRQRVQDLTQQFADVVGKAAQEHPTDWHMLQPVWLADKGVS